MIDEGVRGARESRPALDELVKAARRRRFDTLVVWRLDRLGRNLRHLIMLLDELTALGVGFVSLGEGIDTSTPAGRLQLHILGAIAELNEQGSRKGCGLGLRGRRPKASAWDAHGGTSATRRSLPSLTVLCGRQAQLGVSKSFLQGWRLSRSLAANA